MEEAKKRTKKRAAQAPAGEPEQKEYLVLKDGTEYEVLERGSRYIFCKGAQFRYTNKDVVSILRK